MFVYVLYVARDPAGGGGACIVCILAQFGKMMKLALLTSAAALLASTSAFTASPRVKSPTSLKSYLDDIDTPPPVGGTTDPKAVDAVAAAMLDSSRTQATAAAQTPQTIVIKESSSNSNGLITAGIAFVGAPLWIFLASQFITPPPAEFQLPPSSIPATALSSKPTDAKSAGVVVLSQPITKQEVRNLFNLWNDALKTKDPDIVAQRYSKEGVLLPTLSDVPRNDYAGIRDYFVHFCEKGPVGKILEGEIFVGNNW